MVLRIAARPPVEPKSNQGSQSVNKTLRVRWRMALVAMLSSVGLVVVSTASAAVGEDSAVRGYGTDKLFMYDAASGLAEATPYGVHPGTSPSRARLSSGGDVAAFRGYGTNHLWVYRWPEMTATSTNEGIADGTSPSIAGLPADSAYLIAFRGYGTNNLFIFDSRTGVSTSKPLGIHPGTSPSIAVGKDGSYRVAFRGYGTNNLYVLDSRSGAAVSTSEGIHPDTSPSIAVMDDGSYRVAFRGYGTDNLFIYDSRSGNSLRTNEGLHAGTSPSIARTPTDGYRVAFVGYGTDNLFFFDSLTGQSQRTDVGVSPGSSPGASTTAPVPPPPAGPAPSFDSCISSCEPEVYVGPEEFEDPARSGSGTKCRTVTLGKRLWSGRVMHRSRFCYRISQQITVEPTRKLNTVYVKNNFAGSVWGVHVKSKDPEGTPEGNQYVIDNRGQIATFNGVTNDFHFRVRGLWDGGCMWRVDNKTGICTAA